MASARLVEAIAGSFGQKLTEAKRSGSTTFLSTPDAFLYAFVEDPTHLTEPYVSAMVKKGTKDFKHLVVLTSGHLPEEVRPLIVGRKVTVVEGTRFEHLLKLLGVDELPAPEPASAPGVEHRTLPTAERLDRLMHVGKDWTNQGVPALASRFYAEAVTLKPEYIPGILGLGESYLSLGLADMAKEAFDRVLSIQESNLSALVGNARVHGVHGRIRQEINALKTILHSVPGNSIVLAHLLAAEVEAEDWEEASHHVEALLRLAPGDGQLHAMWAAFLAHNGDREGAAREEAVALSTGLPLEEVQRVYATLKIEEKSFLKGKPKSVLVPPAAETPPALPRAKPAPPAQPSKSPRLRSKPTKGRVARRKK